jgi:hypothetical protein
VPGIGHGDGIGPVRNALACQDLDVFRSGKPIGIEAKMDGQFSFKRMSLGALIGVGARRAKKQSGRRA